jgi:hypothetical protein
MIAQTILVSALMIAQTILVSALLKLLTHDYDLTIFSA